MITWAGQIKCRGMKEHQNDIQVVTKSSEIRLFIGITWINVNHCSGTTLANVKLVYITDCYRLLLKHTERIYHSLELDIASVVF